MLNIFSNNVSIQLSLLFFVTVVAMAVFTIGENSIGSFFPVILLPTAPSPSSGDSSLSCSCNYDYRGRSDKISGVRPERTTITQGGEIFIGNNSSYPSEHYKSYGSRDPLSGKLFNIGVLKSKEYENL